MGNMEYVAGPFAVSVDDGATAYSCSALALELWNGFASPLFTRAELIEMARLVTGEMRADDVVLDEGDALIVELWEDGNGEREAFRLEPVAWLWGATPWEDDRPLYSFGGGIMWSVSVQSEDETRDPRELIFDALMSAGRRADADRFADANGAL